MELLSQDEARALSIVDKVRFSYRDAVVGAIVISAYGGGFAWFALAKDPPTFLIVINVLLWLFFFWYWQRNLRRLLGGTRPYSLATTPHAVVFPLNDIDKDVPPELDLVAAIDADDIERTELIDQRSVVYRRGGSRHGRRSTNVRTCFLRMHLRKLVSQELKDSLAAIRKRNGFGIVHVFVPAEDVVEVFVGGTQLDALEKMLASLALRLKPARLKKKKDLRSGGDPVDFERMRSGGLGLIVEPGREEGLLARRGQD